MMEATAEELYDWLRELRASGPLIIVEGMKDRHALLQLGIRKVMHLNKPLYQIVEEIAEREKDVVILTDLDAKGKQLYGKLKKDLVAHGVKVDRHFREFLQRKTKVSHIEGLETYIRHQEDKDEKEEEENHA